MTDHQIVRTGMNQLAGRKIFATGGSMLPPDVIPFANALGKHLITDSECQIITGGLKRRDSQSTAADWEYVFGALEGSKTAQVNPTERIITMLPKEGPSCRERFYAGKVLNMHRTHPRARRYSMVLASDAVVAIGGDKGTREVLDLAWTVERPFLPVPGTGGAAQGRTHKTIRHHGFRNGVAQ